jgi:hypothetical protein
MQHILIFFLYSVGIHATMCFVPKIGINKLLNYASLIKYINKLFFIFLSGWDPNMVL